MSLASGAFGSLLGTAFGICLLLWSIQRRQRVRAGVVVLASRGRVDRGRCLSGVVGSGRWCTAAWTTSSYKSTKTTVWQGAPHDYAHDGAVETLPEIRRLLFEGKQKEAERLAGERFMSVPLRQKAYQKFADLLIDFRHGEAKPDHYRRTLDLQPGRGNGRVHARRRDVST